MTLEIKDYCGNPVSLKPRVGLYSVTDFMGKEMPGLAIILDTLDGEEYAVLTVSFGEFISIKNSAYIDTNNCPFAEELLDHGIAKATRSRKSSGFCTYPLWIFNEDFLKEIGGDEYQKYSEAYDQYYKSSYPEEDIEDEDESDNEIEDENENNAKNISCDEFKQVIKEIVESEDTLMIHVSPDFQCDQSCGFPVSLCVSWKQGKAWLSPNEMLLDENQDITNVWQGCAEFGIQECNDTEDFNTILQILGSDAYSTAYIPPENDENEGMNLL